MWALQPRPGSATFLQQVHPDGAAPGQLPPSPGEFFPRASYQSASPHDRDWLLATLARRPRPAARVSHSETLRSAQEGVCDTPEPVSTRSATVGRDQRLSPNPFPPDNTG